MFVRKRKRKVLIVVILFSRGLTFYDSVPKCCHFTILATVLWLLLLCVWYLVSSTANTARVCCFYKLASKWGHGLVQKKPTQNVYGLTNTFFLQSDSGTTPSLHQNVPQTSQQDPWLFFLVSHPHSFSHRTQSTWQSSRSERPLWDRKHDRYVYTQ